MPRRKPRDPLTEMGYLRQEVARCVEDCLAMANHLLDVQEDAALQLEQQRRTTAVMILQLQDMRNVTFETRSTAEWRARIDGYLDQRRG